MGSSNNRQLTIALAGNPNSGKTTVFNGLTGSRQRIGNWPGVTVERKEGVLSGESIERFLAEPFVPSSEHPGARFDARVTETALRENPARTKAEEGRDEDREEVRVVDLPGIYSLSASSQDEIVARDFLLGGEVDLVVNIVDASNIQRNLFLTLQLIEMRVPTLVVLNMADVARKKGMSINVAHLSEHLGCPVVEASAVREEGMRRIRSAVFDHVRDARSSTIEIRYPEPLEQAIHRLYRQTAPFAQMVGADGRWVALSLLEGEPWVLQRVAELTNSDAQEIDSLRNDIEKELGEEIDIVVADAKYGFINGLSRHVTRTRIDRQTLTERVDRVVMNRFLALPIFFGVMYGVFWVTMSIGGAFIDFFDIAVGAIVVDGFAAILEMVAAPEWLTTLLAGGIGSGIQTVATFIPIIFTMFLMLALLEDSGYMARAAYVMDRFMRLIGLPGKSFVPMMVGFGCTVPAILATRTLETRRDRFITIFMSPNMSCGARLPVYALFAAAFFAQRAGTVVFSLYVIGIVVAILTGFLLKLTLFRGTPSHFVMELPPYHAPRVRFVAGEAWRRLLVFLRRAGVTITIIVTVLAVLNTFRAEAGPRQEAGAVQESHTVLSRIGRAITPVFSPMGIEQDNWPATVGLFTGIFAKEAVIGALNSLYGQSEMSVDENANIAGSLKEAAATIPSNLAGALGGLTDPLGAAIVGSGEGVATEVGADVNLLSRLRSRFSSPSAYAYLLFVLIYFPCAAALAAAIREMGPSLGWALAAYSTIVAWVVAVSFYQFATGPELGAVLTAFGVLVALIASLALLGRTVYRADRLEKSR